MVSNNYYCVLDLQKWVMKREWSILFRQTRKKPVNHRCVLLSLKTRLVSVSVIRATRFLHASGTYKGNDVKFSIFNSVHWLLSMFLIVTIVTIHQVATCWKEHNSFLNMWPFTRLGGLSKFHAMPIFTIQAVKVRKIFGMWVKFLFHAVNTPWKIHGYRENFTQWKSL